MQLLTICGIDASDEVLPVAWGLVPIENTKWWTWVLEALRGCFPDANWEDYVFISDREKGIPASLSTIFPEAFQAHCCQHIANNVAAEYGNKCKPLFWVCARAKTKQAFQNALQELRRHKVAAADYINAIPHETWTRYVQIFKFIQYFFCLLLIVTPFQSLDLVTTPQTSMSQSIVLGLILDLCQRSRC
jgi:hypothetical protein